MEAISPHHLQILLIAKQALRHPITSRSLPSKHWDIFSHHLQILLIAKQALRHFPPITSRSLPSKHWDICVPAKMVGLEKCDNLCITHACYTHLTNMSLCTLLMHVTHTWRTCPFVHYLCMLHTPDEHVPLCITYACYTHLTNMSLYA